MSSPPRDPYKELFERSADAILIIEGDKFVECNDAAVRMLRYATREEVLSTHPSELSPPNQPDGRSSFEKANEIMAIAFEQGSHRFEWAHRRADGEVFPVEVLLTAIEEEDRRVLHVVWRDISERRALEERLRHAQKMEAVGKLAGGIAHDFNNLLVVILGHTDLLSDLVDDEPEYREHADAIRGAGQRAAALVKQLLAFGRKQQRLPQVLDLNGLVDGLRKMLERLIGEDLVLETHLTDAALPIEVDVGQIEQAIMNLVSNARDASPSGGVLRIETSLYETPAHGEAGLGGGPYGVVSVSDSGVGMAPDVLERAFDPFFTTKAPGHGTGLGLATVYGIVEESRGAVRIDSTLGSGTTVRVLLPLTEKGSRRATPAEPRSVTPEGQGERILVVEDDPTVRRLVVRALTGLGYTVTSATDGLEGVERYVEQSGGFDLIVSDVIMPGAGGAQMVDLLVERGHRPRVLFLSGYTDDALSALHARGGEVDLLPKPFSAVHLAQRVRRALDREPPQAEQSPGEDGP